MKRHLWKNIAVVVIALIFLLGVGLISCAPQQAQPDLGPLKANIAAIKKDVASIRDFRSIDIKIRDQVVKARADVLSGKGTDVALAVLGKPGRRGAPGTPGMAEVLLGKPGARGKPGTPPAVAQQKSLDTLAEEIEALKAQLDRIEAALAK